MRLSPLLRLFLFFPAGSCFDVARWHDRRFDTMAFDMHKHNESSRTGRDIPQRGKGRKNTAFPGAPPRTARGWLPLDDLPEPNPPPQESRLIAQQDWSGLLPLWTTALRAGGGRFWQVVEQRRRALFKQPVRLHRFAAIYYHKAPSALHDELTWLRELDVRRVVLPFHQAASTVVREKTLAATQNLHVENCLVSAVLRQDASTSAEDWKIFCETILARTSWHLERLQWCGGMEEPVQKKAETVLFSYLFHPFPKMRHDYPGVAFAAPVIGRYDAPDVLRALWRLLPDGYKWDDLCLSASGDNHAQGKNRDAFFLRQLLLAGSAASFLGIANGRVQVCFTPTPLGEASLDHAENRVRRMVLALASGVTEQIMVGVDPSVAPEQRAPVLAGIKDLVAHLDNSRFVRRHHAGDRRQDFVFEFARADHSPLLVGWTNGESHQVFVPFSVHSAQNFTGKTAPLLPYPRLWLTPQLTYFCGV